MDLPNELVSSVIKRGQILRADIFKDIDHRKYFIIIGIYEGIVAGFFYINSHINSNINTKEEQLEMQYPIFASDYSFLHHDSYICATDIKLLSCEELCKHIKNGNVDIIDNLKDEHLQDLLEKLRNSKLFSKIKKNNFFY